MTDSARTTTPLVCTTCRTHPALRGGTQCATCHPLTSHDAYRAGLCCQCRNTRHSAGRPRCNECHLEYTTDGQSTPKAS